MSSWVDKMIAEMREFRHNYSKFCTYGSSKLGNKAIENLRRIKRYSVMAHKDMKIEVQLVPKIESSELLNDLLKLKRKNK